MSRANPARGARPVVVLADDNEAEISILRPVLEKHNFQVVLAADGEHALNLALKLSARLVIASLKLPRMDGYQLCQKLREQRSTETIPFMFITAQGEIPDKLMGHQTFASDYVQRPINVIEFENRLSAVLRVQAGQQSRHMAPTSEMDSPAADLGKKLFGQEALPSQQEKETTSDEVENLLSEFKTWKTPPTASSSASENGETLDNILQEFRGRTATDPLREKIDRGATRPADVTKEETLKRVPPVPEIGEVQQPVKKEDAKTAPAAPMPVEKVQLSRTQDYKDVGELAELVYQEANIFLLASIRRVEDGETVDIIKGTEIAKRIVESLKKDNGLLLLAMERTSEFTLARHSVNVAIIAARIGQTLGMPEDRSIRLGMAGLVHDIGSAKLKEKLLYKRGQFSASERAEIERRPIYSAQILSNMGFDWLPQLVIQVHERENGKGYPHGLEGKEITEEGKVLGIADLFEARIHERPHRQAMTGYQLLESLTSEGGSFSDRIIKALIRSFSVYPFNEYVVLNTGEIGKVIDISAENTLRPTVKVLFSADGEPVGEHKIINLARNASLFITRAIPASSVPK